MRFLMQRSVFEQLRYFSHLFYPGNAISDAHYKTLVSLCIAIILLFSAWLVILVEVLIYCCRHHLRKNRFVQITNSLVQIKSSVSHDHRSTVTLETLIPPNLVPRTFLLRFSASSKLPGKALAKWLSSSLNVLFHGDMSVYFVNLLLSIFFV